MDKNIMNLREAAESLGVSTDTIRRRIKTGMVQAEKVQGPYGPEWQIDINSMVEPQNIIEAVTVKTNIDPDKLLESIRQAVLEAAGQAVRNETTEAMESQRVELESLRNEVGALRALIEQQQEDKEVLTLTKRIKGLFSSNK